MRRVQTTKPAAASSGGAAAGAHHETDVRYLSTVADEGLADQNLVSFGHCGSSSIAKQNVVEPPPPAGTFCAKGETR